MDWVTMTTPAFQIVARTVIVYLVVLIGLRLAGKREIGQFTPFDLVLVLLIANAVQNAMVGSDNSLIGGLVAAVTLLIVNYLVSLAASRTKAGEELMVGVPTVLVHEGNTVEKNLRREGISPDELEAVVREHGLEDISKVKLAVLEVDGSVSVVPESSNVIKTKRHFRYKQRR